MSHAFDDSMGCCWIFLVLIDLYSIINAFMSYCEYIRLELPKEIINLNNKIPNGMYNFKTSSMITQRVLNYWFATTFPYRYTFLIWTLIRTSINHNLYESYSCYFTIEPMILMCFIILICGTHGQHYFEHKSQVFGKCEYRGMHSHHCTYST